jgi:hypothetical protein
MGNLMLCRSLDAALEDDDAAIRALNNNIDGNGTGRILLSIDELTFSLHVGQSDPRRLGVI